MKKLIATTATLLSAFQIFAQGTISFGNSPSQLISNLVTQAAVPTGSGYGVGLYYGVAGTVDERTLILLATTIIQPIPGRFVGGTVTTPNSTAPGGNCVVQIRAWSGGYANYDLAYAAALADDNIFVAESAMFVQATGNPNSSPAIPPAALVNLQAFSGPPIPEPSTMALGLLGLGAMAYFCRRK